MCKTKDVVGVVRESFWVEIYCLVYEFSLTRIYTSRQGKQRHDKGEEKLEEEE